MAIITDKRPGIGDDAHALAASVGRIFPARSGEYGLGRAFLERLAMELAPVGGSASCCATGAFPWVTLALRQRGESHHWRVTHAS